MFTCTFVDNNKKTVGFGVSTYHDAFSRLSTYSVSFQCHNVTIMKNAQGDRVIIQEVK